MGCSSSSLCRLQRDRECDIWGPSFYVKNEMSQIPAAALKMEEITRSMCVLIFKVMEKKKPLKNAKLPLSSLHSHLEPLLLFFFFRNNCDNKSSIASSSHDLVRFSIASIKTWKWNDAVALHRENSILHSRKFDTIPQEPFFTRFAMCWQSSNSLPLKAAEEVRDEGARLMSIKSLDQNSDWFYLGSTLLGFTRKQCQLPSHISSIGFLIIWVR